MLDKAKNTGPQRKYLRNANVQWFRFDLSDLLELRLEDRDLEAHVVRQGDLVICEGGEPGRSAVCGSEVDGMVFQKALHRARPRPGIHVWYLAYLLRCYAVSGYLASFFTGATNKHDGPVAGGRAGPRAAVGGAGTHRRNSRSLDGPV